MNNLAALYQRQERFADAASRCASRALGIRERSLGPSHPDLAQSLNNMATHYESRRHHDAEPLIKRSLAIREKVLGSDHPDVARSLNNLADLYERLGRLAVAEPLYRRALSIRERAVGADHPDTAISTNNLAFLYRAEGRVTDALPLVQRMISGGRAQPRVALPVLFDAQRRQLLGSVQALDDALNVIQRGTQSSAASAVNKLTVRIAAGNDRLAELVRRDQDLGAEAEALRQAMLGYLNDTASPRNAYPGFWGPFALVGEGAAR